MAAFGEKTQKKMILTSTEKHLVVSTYRLVVPVSETVADLFYRRLFQERPQYRGLFSEDMTKQKRKFMMMIAFITNSLNWTEEQWKEEVAVEEDLFLVVLALGRRHHLLYKIPDDAYEPVEGALLWALEQGLGAAFTPELRRAWTKLYRVLATSMKMGAQASRVRIEFGRIA